jgi:hypothetical protein
MSMFQALAAAATVIGIVGTVLLTVRLTAARNAAQPRHRAVALPDQRSPVTKAELMKLNQAYGAGEVGEAEYWRRRRALVDHTE